MQSRDWVHIVSFSLQPDDCLDKIPTVSNVGTRYSLKIFILALVKIAVSYN